MSFTVRIRSDLSIHALSVLRQQGFSVMKTPHVGNIYTNNLIMANAGILMNFYDRTIGQRDRNFHPHKLICNKEAEIVSCGTRLTTHAYVQSPSTRSTLFTPGRRLVDCHMEAMHRAMPQAECVVYTDYLKARVDRVLAILEIATSEYPQIWTHQVSSEGERLSLQVKNWKELQECGIYGLTCEEHGALLPNVLNVLVDGIIEAERTGLNEVYHLSGPDMVHYIGSMTDLLTQVYDLVAGRIGLPQQQVFHLLPVASVRLAGDIDHKAEIDELVEAWLSLEKGNRDRSERIRSVKSEDRMAVIGQCTEEKTRAGLRFREAALVADVVFYDISQANCFTQHDMLHGRSFYVHPWAYEGTVDQISTLIHVATRHRQARK